MGGAHRHNSARCSADVPAHAVGFLQLGRQWLRASGALVGEFQMREKCWKNAGGNCGKIAGKCGRELREQCGNNAGKMREICGKYAGSMRDDIFFENRDLVPQNHRNRARDYDFLNPRKKLHGVPKFSSKSGL